MEGVPSQQQLSAAVPPTNDASTQQQSVLQKPPADVPEATKPKRQLHDEQHHVPTYDNQHLHRLHHYSISQTQTNLPTSNEDTSANQQPSYPIEPKDKHEHQTEAPAKRRRISPLDGEEGAGQPCAEGAAGAAGSEPSSTIVSADASPSKSSDSPIRSKLVNIDSASAPPPPPSLPAVAAMAAELSIPSAAKEVQEPSADVELPPYAATTTAAASVPSPIPCRLVPPNAPAKMSHLYRPGEVLPDLQPFLHQIVEIKIPAKHLSTRNKEIRTRQLWGTDVYTDDSDIVAVLMHSGFYTLRSTPPSKIAGISAFIRILPARKDYDASTRNQLRSRSWAPLYRNFSFEIIRIRILRGLDEFGGSHGKVSKSVSGSGNGRRGTTRLRFAPDLTIVYNSSNEACLMYCLALIGDRGMPSEAWTSSRLRNEVLYLEAKDNTRFELYCSQQASIQDGKHFDTYTFSRVKQEVLNRSVVASSLLNPAPLPSTESDALFCGLDWEEIKWGPHCVCVREQRFMLDKLWFRPRRSL